MSKISLSNLLSGFLSTAKLNSNMAAITAAFDNTLSRDGTTPNTMMAQLDMGGNRIINLGTPVNPTDAVRLADLGGGGSSGAVSVDWSVITNKPTSFTPTTHSHPESDVTNLVSDISALQTGKANTVHTHVSTDITDWTSAVKSAVAAYLAAGTNVNITNSGGLLTISATGSTGGAATGSLGSSSTSPNFKDVFGGVGDGVTNSDSAVTNSENDTNTTWTWVPNGVFKLNTKTTANLKKHYWGSGTIKTADGYTLPARFSYADALPTGYADQGISGWFDGDHRFGAPQYNIVGPNARTYDLTQKYYCAQLTPHNEWFDILSGNSGGQAFLPAGAAIGATSIQINGTPSAEWVGKSVAFFTTSVFTDGVSPPLETTTCTAIDTVNNKITVSPALTHSYTWNPGAGLSPCIAFGNHTMNTHSYIKVTHNAGGDGYGHVVRMNVGYPVKPTETHTYMGACGGQYGGDINFQASGNRATGWESQYHDNGYGVGVIGQVDTFYRTNDVSPDGSGQTWLGILLKSGSTRPIDAAYVYGGLARNGFDTAAASMIETSYLTVSAGSGATQVTVANANGAVIGDPIQIGEDASSPFVGTITAVSGNTITFTPATSASYGVNTFVKLANGGAAVNLALKQRIVFNSTFSSSKRSGDSTGVFNPLYGNTQGDIIMEANTDATSDYWCVRYTGNGHSAATARIRLRPTAMQVNVPISTSGSLTAQNGINVSGDGGSVYGAAGSSVINFSGGSGGNFLRYNTTTNNFELYKGGSRVAFW